MVLDLACALQEIRVSLWKQGDPSSQLCEGGLACRLCLGGDH